MATPVLLVKAYRPEQHPREPAGATGPHHGGEFAKKPEAASETLDLTTLVQWSAPRRVQTRDGERDLLTGRPDEKFWAMWRANKDALKAAGISCGKNNQTGDWEAQWWRPIDLKEAKAKEKAVEASRATDSILRIPVPDGLQYLPYQKAGISYGLSHNNVLIGDEMGLGKTIQAIGISNADKKVKKVLVVCPASLKINWEREWTKWDTKGMTVGIATTKGLPDTDVVIVNYDILSKMKTALDARKWDMRVLDEVHYAKNPDAIRTVALFGRKAKRATGSTPAKEAVPPIAATRTVALTGTPIVNRPVELCGLLESLDPEGLGKDRMKFMFRYCNAQRGRYGWDFSGASNLEELQRLMRERFMVRRLKSEVLKELPPKRRQVVVLEPTAEAKAIMKEMEASSAAARMNKKMDSFGMYGDDDGFADDWDEVGLLDDEDDEVGTGAGKVVRKQAAGEKMEGKTADFAEISKFRHKLAVAKAPQVIEYCKELLESVPKILIFAHHKDVVNQLMAAFPGEAVKVTGETPNAARMQAVDKFQEDPKVRVFVGNIKAAGVGLTLTAADNVVFAELDWAPGNVTQAEDRAHRIGQTKSVNIHHLVYDKSLDARIVNAMVDKQNVMDAALDNRAATKTIKGATTSIEAKVAKPKAPVLKIKVTAPPPPPKIDPDDPVNKHDLIRQALRQVAGMDDDRAAAINGVGFSKFDGDFGHDMAHNDHYTPAQAAAALRLARKYRGQISTDVADQLKLHDPTPEQKAKADAAAKIKAEAARAKAKEEAAKPYTMEDHVAAMGARSARLIELARMPATKVQRIARELPGHPGGDIPKADAINVVLNHEHPMREEPAAKPVKIARTPRMAKMLVFRKQA